MAEAMSGKKFGHKVSAPRPLGQRISNERLAKPGQRVKGRRVRQQNKEAKKRGKVNHRRAFAALMPSKAEHSNGVSHMARLRRAMADVRAELESNTGTVNNSVLYLSHLRAAGEVLASITSRREKLPRMIAELPKQKNWLKKLFYTSPEKWSAVAVLKVTKVFMPQGYGYGFTLPFAQKVLLPLCRDNIIFYKHLNQHFYMALRCLLKKCPEDFFDGIVQPLCQGGDCSVREAIVFSNVLMQNSPPCPVASIAICNLCQLPYSGATSIFLRVLLNKKYVLRYEVIDAVVAHFLSCQQETRALPTLWHQNLLLLAQRYKSYLTQRQKEDLKSLAAYHSHRLITREVHLQLDTSPCRSQ